MQQHQIALAAEGLQMTYGETRALAGVDLSIGRGEICAVLGHNGAGKTTFIRCALGLTRPDVGATTVLGHPAGSPAARQRIGAMLQDVDLPDLLTAREQLELYASYYEAPASVEAVIATANITAFADERYKKLSGGQKRRVQFAAALIGQPELLFLDEPTTGLDTDARRAVWDNVRRLAAAGTTVVLTTHYLEEADALADRIVVLADGAVIADDTTSAIRDRVGGARISFASSLGEAQLAALPGVVEISVDDSRVALLSDRTNATLSAVLAADPNLTDLNVRRPSLEEAFSVLTASTPSQGAQV